MIEITIQRIETKANEKRSFDVNEINKVQGESLVEVLAKMLMVVAIMQRKIDKENEQLDIDHDIPF